MNSSDFQTGRLIKELKQVFRELNKSFSEEIAYAYILNYILKRIGEECSIDLEYCLPEIDANGASDQLGKIMEPWRYCFETVAVSKLLGEVYEGVLDKGMRKKLGLYYTPEGIVEFIVDNTIKYADIVKKPNLKVLDPSCGSGNFLIKTYDILKDKFAESIDILKETYKSEIYQIWDRGRVTELKGSEYWIRDLIHYHIISNCIYGADVDQSGVALTKNCLRMKADGVYRAEPNIALCDSLVKWEHYEGALKEFWNKKFDFIIGNPPWVSLSRKQGIKIPREKLDYYKNNYNGSTYLPNLYEYFLERSLELLADSGAVGFLLPDRFAGNEQYRDFRKHILQRYNIRNIRSGIKLEHIIADSMAIIIENSFQIDNVILVTDRESEFRVCQKELLNGSENQFISISGESGALYYLINDNSKPLKEAAHTFTGFIGIHSNIRDLQGKDMVPVLKGANIEKYRIKGCKYYSLVPENIIGGTKNINKLKLPDKIIVRKTGKELMAAMDKEGVAIEQSLYGIVVTNNEYLPEYILSVINSSLMQWYYTNFLVTNLNSTPQLKKIHLDRIPIKYCSMEKQIYIKKMVSEMESSTADEFEMLKDKIDKEIYGIYQIKKVPHGRHVERI